MKDWFAHKVLVLPELASSNGKAVDDLMVYVHWLMLVLFVGWIFISATSCGGSTPRAAPRPITKVPKAICPNTSKSAWCWSKPSCSSASPCRFGRKTWTIFRSRKTPPSFKSWRSSSPGTPAIPDSDGKFGRQDMKLISSDNVFGVDPADPAGKDDIQVLNEIHVPVNKPVLIYLSSKDVIHSLKIVAMRLTQDAIPGLRIPCTFTPTKIGRYQIECAQLCGNGHAAMAGGFIVVQSQADFDAWLKSKSGAAAPTSFE